MYLVLFPMAGTKMTEKVTKPVPGGDSETQSLTLRIKDSVRDDLDLVAEFKGALGATELARGWILDELNKVKADKLYQMWLERTKKKSTDPRQAQIA
jgi:hypothetical protein